MRKENRQGFTDETAMMVNNEIYRIYKDWMNGISECARFHHCPELEKLLVYIQDGRYRSPEHPQLIQNIYLYETALDVQWLMDGAFERLKELMIRVIRLPEAFEEGSTELKPEAAVLLNKAESAYITLETFIDMLRDYGINLEPPFVSYRNMSEQEKQKRIQEELILQEETGRLYQKLSFRKMNDSFFTK